VPFPDGVATILDLKVRANCPIASDAGKYFASFYALFSGLLFIGAASIIVAPFVHRIMHQLHMDED
jgi:hypothetical protein